MDRSILYGETQAVDDYVDLDDQGDGDDHDDVRSNEGYVRSIAAIHATSFRSSGLPAAKSTASEATKEALKSSCYSSGNCNNQVNGVSDKDKELETRNSQKISHELDSPCSYVPRNTEVSSYIGSQPPGDLSQANALDIVDNFLVVNYFGLSQVGLSQEVNTKKSSYTVKSLPIPLAKGIQSLAKKTDRTSPIGKMGIFEWTDSFEDDGGCELFTKQTDSFFKRKEESRSHPPKSRYDASFGLGYTGDSITNHPKTTNFARSESRLNRPSSLVIDEVLESETRTKRNLFRDLNEQSNSRYLEPQSKVTDNGGGDGGTYEVGPDTQMVDGNMEAHTHSSLINKEINGAGPTAGKFARRTTYSKAALPRNPALSSPNLNDVSNSTPIAHRTRRSKAASLSKMAGTEYGKDTNVTVKRSLIYPQRRRIRRTAPDEPNANEDLNNQGKQPRNVKRKIRSTVKSTSEIPGAAKRKKRPFSTHNASDIDGLNSDGEKAQPLSNMRTRSSLKSPSLEPNVENPLLQGRRVYITPNAKPTREVCSSLVKAAGGQPLVRLGRSATKDDVLVLSCEEDYAHCILLLDKGVEVFSSELVLNGIVIQKLEFERHRLFLDHVVEGPDGWTRG